MLQLARKMPSAENSTLCDRPFLCRRCLSRSCSPTQSPLEAASKECPIDSRVRMPSYVNQCPCLIGDSGHSSRQPRMCVASPRFVEDPWRRRPATHVLGLTRFVSSAHSAPVYLALIAIQQTSSGPWSPQWLWSTLQVLEHVTPVAAESQDVINNVQLAACARDLTESVNIHPRERQEFVKRRAETECARRFRSLNSHLFVHLRLLRQRGKSPVMRPAKVTK